MQALSAMEISESKAFAIFTSVGLLCAIVLIITTGERVEGGIDVQYSPDMAAWEVAFLSYGLVAVFLNVFVAAFDAYAQSYKKWAIFSVIAWPVSFVFVWLSATGYFRRQRKARGT